jgi:hypothetical protein
MKHEVTLLAVIVTTLALPAGATQAPTATQTEGKNPTAPSSEGVEITGVVMDYDTKMPVTSGTVHAYLRKGDADEKGWAPVEDTKIASKVESTGRFRLAGVKPGTYLLMVEEPGALPFAFAVVRGEDGKTMTVEVTTKLSVDVGRVWVQFHQ